MYFNEICYFISKHLIRHGSLKVYGSVFFSVSMGRRNIETIRKGRDMSIYEFDEDDKLGNKRNPLYERFGDINSEI
ncbi:MAG: hypothetical protein NC094_13480 [Bacteroidales bacterium]|nr:hypothetical protein [Lachnoclostridium sp.]MCM1384375.1 hypothetical protein [Lachnoclostridium sp.]MCM1466415.1 hypothetical protein [Bacteroidales bacterium]